MRDNRNIEELSDQAWAKMQDLLDQEMPVRSGTRRPLAFWWFYLAAAILLIGTVSFLFLRPGSSLDGNLPLAQDQGTVDQATSRKEQEQSNSILELSGASTTPSNQIKTDESENKTIVNATSTLVENDDNLSVNTGISGGPSDIDPMNTILEDKQQGMTSATVGEMIKKLEENLASVDPTLAENSSEPTVNKEGQPASINLVPLARRPISDLEQAPLPLPRMNLYDPKKSMFVRPEINAGVIGSLQAGTVSGLLAEARSGLKLHRTGKWSFQTGVGIHRQEEPFSVDFQSSGSIDEQAAGIPGQDQNSNDPLALGAGSVSITQAVASSEVRLQSTYFDVPLLLNWRVAPRWSIAAGSRLSWLLSAQWKGKRNATLQAQTGVNGTLYAFDVSESNRQFSIYQQNSGSAPVTFRLQDFYASGTLGITFRPHLKWHLRLQYQHSLTNLLDDAVFQTTDRSLWLSAGIRF